LNSGYHAHQTTIIDVVKLPCGVAARRCSQKRIKPGLRLSVKFVQTRGCQMAVADLLARATTSSGVGGFGGWKERQIGVLSLNGLPLFSVLK
jgi:hypothetical protein